MAPGAVGVEAQVHLGRELAGQGGQTPQFDCRGFQADLDLHHAKASAALSPDQVGRHLPQAAQGGVDRHDIRGPGVEPLAQGQARALGGEVQQGALQGEAGGGGGRAVIPDGVEDPGQGLAEGPDTPVLQGCLLYTSDAADE